VCYMTATLHLHFFKRSGLQINEKSSAVSLGRPSNEHVPI
jgi:hypothetical protein